jgi:hypothetical protein
MDLHHFELSLKPLLLKKAIKLYEGGLVEHDGHRSLSRTFYVKGEKVEVSVTHGRVGHWLCSCGKRPYCEHFAAALFLIQKNGSKIEITEPRRKNATPDFDKLRKNLVAVFSSESSRLPIAVIERKFGRYNGGDPGQLFFHLGVIAALASFSGKESDSHTEYAMRIFNASRTALSQKKQVGGQYKDICLDILKRSLSIHGLKGDCFRFMIAFILSRFTDPATHSLVSHLVRRYKSKLSAEFNLNWYNVFLNQITLSGETRRWNAVKDTSDMETAVAYCELKIASGSELDKPVNHYLKGAPFITNPSFLRYILSAASFIKDQRILHKTAGKLMLHSPFITDLLWERFQKGNAELTSMASEIITTLQAERHLNWQEKVVWINLYLGNTGAVKEALMNGDHRFSFVHEVAVKALPEDLSSEYAGALMKMLMDYKQAALRSINLERASLYAKALKGFGIKSRSLREALLNASGLDDSGIEAEENPATVLFKADRIRET